MQFERPKQLREALALLDAQRWDILAGGTDYYPGLRDNAPTTPVLDITAIGDLRRIKREDGHWRIGALVTWSDIIAADLPPAFAGLKLAAREVGSVQIQNRATIAGNICNASPAADGVPPLLTLDAEIELSSTNGTRHLPLAAFITGNRATMMTSTEMVTAILVPEKSASGHSHFLKLGARKYLVISIAMAAVRIGTGPDGRVSEAAVSVGSCSEVAKRLPALEEAIVGRAHGEAGDAVSADQLACLAPIDDVRATAAYRSAAAVELVQRTILACAAQGH